MRKLTNERLTEIRDGTFYEPKVVQQHMAAELLELRERGGAPASIVDCVLEAQAAPDYSKDLDRIADALEKLAECVKDDEGAYLATGI